MAGPIWVLEIPDTPCLNRDMEQIFGLVISVMSCLNKLVSTAVQKIDYISLVQTFLRSKYPVL